MEPGSAEGSRIVHVPLRAKDGSLRGVAVLDYEDAWIAAVPWRLQPNGYAIRGGARADGTFYLHRCVLGLQRGDPREGDHRDGDRLNCRRSNLRIVTPAENAWNASAQNRRVPTSSRHRGVTWDASRGLWQTQFQMGGVRHTAGRFAKEDEAAGAIHALRERLLPAGSPNRR